MGLLVGGVIGRTAGLGDQFLEPACIKGTDQVVNDCIHLLIQRAGESTERPTEPFSVEDRAFIEMMGQRVEYELERERREQRLERSKQQFQRIFENSQDAIFINDPHADEILEANPAGCEMLGYEKSDIRARGLSDFHPTEMDRFRKFVDTVDETGTGGTD